MENSFEKLANKILADALLKQGIEQPTDIQKEVIPFIIEKKDVIASSHTGSGKTLAYLLPLFMMADKDIKNPQAIIVTPTHELAVQVCKQAELLAKNAEGYEWIEPTLLIGGANIQRQIDKLKKKPRIIVGSVGRMLELIKLKKLTSHFAKTIIIDEADRLLDKANLDNIKALIKTTLRDRQVVLLSASIEKNTVEIAKEFMKEPTIVNVSSKDKLPKSIEHIYLQGEDRDKIKLLRKLVHSQKIDKGIVFLSNPDATSIDSTAEKLNFHGIKCSAIYGDVQKHDRRQALLDFREGRVKLLVASDLAARGLDFKGLTHVINYDMPEDADLYLHRAGRCGRMGEKGMCISLVTVKDKEYVKKMERIFKIKIEEKTMSFGDIKDTTTQKSKTNTVNNKVANNKNVKDDNKTNEKYPKEHKKTFRDNKENNKYGRKKM